jgi:hypothetical protein
LLDADHDRMGIHRQPPLTSRQEVDESYNRVGSPMC